MNIPTTPDITWTSTSTLPSCTIGNTLKTVAYPTLGSDLCECGGPIIHANGCWLCMACGEGACSR